MSNNRDNKKKILDVGCGFGANLSSLMSRGDVYAIDLSEKAIDFARNKFPKVNFLNETIENTNFSINFFNEIHCYDVLEHVNDIDKTFAEISRIIKDDGKIIIEIPYYKSEILLKKINQNYFEQVGHKYIFTPQKLLHYLNKYNLIIEKTTPKKFYDNVYLILSFLNKQRITNQQGSVSTKTTNDKINRFLVELVLGESSVLENRDDEIINEIEKRFGVNITNLQSALFSADKIFSRIFPKTIRLECKLIQGSINRKIDFFARSKDKQNKLDLYIDKLSSSRHITFQKKIIDELHSKKLFISKNVKTLEEKNEQIREKDLLLNSIHSSLSWKLTSPFRKLNWAIKNPRIFILKYRRIIYRLSPNFVKNVYRQLRRTLHRNSILEGYKINSVGKKEYDIIVFPIIDWHFRIQRPQQLMRKFASNGYRVFYINPKIDNISKKNASYEEIKDRIKTSKLEKNISEVTIISYSYLNIYKDTLDDSNKDYLVKSIKALRKKASIRSAICIVNLPFWTPLIKEMRSYWNKIVYDCMDEHSDFSTVSENMAIQEKKLFKISDLITVSGNKLYNKVKNIVPEKNVVKIKNAVDFKHFNQALNDEKNKLKKYKPPIIGYYGAISDWFDCEIVKYLARKKPEWNIVLIGRTFGCPIEKFSNFKNIHLLGEKKYKVLPHHAKKFDVCMIPFKITPLIESTNPVKFYEFMSMGKPIVASNLPELKPYKDHVYFASTKEEFLRQTEKALREDSKERKSERINLARENTWNARFKIMKRNIDKVYPKVSIVVITYNNLDYNKQCIESIISKSNYPNYEIIIVDNLSTDGTRDYLREIDKKHKKIEVILNKDNKGFAPANNQGIKTAKGDYVVLLNNDTVVTKDWIIEMMKYFKDSKIGAVGPVTNSIGNEAMISAKYKRINDMEKFAKKYTEKNKNKYFEIPVLAMFCVMYSRKIIDKVGLLDERYVRGFYEDDDYAYRLKQAGYKNVCAEDVFIHHYGSASFNKLSKKDYQELVIDNRKRFEEKFKIKWKKHNYRDENKIKFKKLNI